MIAAVAQKQEMIDDVMIIIHHVVGIDIPIIGRIEIGVAFLFGFRVAYRCMFIILSNRKKCKEKTANLLQTEANMIIIKEKKRCG